MNERYVLHGGGGTWFYYLSGDALGCEVLADGTPMTSLGQGHRAGWWAADHEAAVITLRKPRRPLTLSYRLRDRSALSQRYPAELSLEDWELRTTGEDDADRAALYHLYESVTEDQDPEVTEVTGPWLRLDGEPPPDDGRCWTASLPAALRNRREYLHLFPGYLAGFRDHLKAVIGALPRVRFVTETERRHGAVFGLDITIEVPFDQPVTEYQPAYNLDGTVSRSRKGRMATVTARRGLVWPTPYRIDGPNRAAAAAEWDRRTAEAVAAVEAMSVEACAACRGKGWVGTGTGASS